MTKKNNGAERGDGDEKRLLCRTCMECGKPLFIIVEPEGTYSGGHYFGSFDLPDEDSDGEHVKTCESVSGFNVVEWTGEDKTYEYWECDECQGVTEKRLSETEAQLFLSLLARVEDDLDRAFTDASEGVFGDEEDGSFEGKWGAPGSQVMVEESRSQYRQFVKHAYVNVNDETHSAKEAVEDARAEQRKINERVEWDPDELFPGPADQTQEVEEADRDDLEEHRKRIRRLIKQERDVLDQLEDYPDDADDLIPEDIELAEDSKRVREILAEELGGEAEEYTVESYIEELDEEELREWLDFYMNRSQGLYEDKLALEIRIEELKRDD